MADKTRVLHFTPHNENCGIGKYQEQFLAVMVGMKDVENEVFKYSPYQTRGMSEIEFTPILNKLVEQMQNFDILHIQHELAFFKHGELARMIRAVQTLGKKVLITVHTAPDAEYQQPRLSGFGPHSLVHYARTKRAAGQTEQNHLVGLRLANLVLVHNAVTKESLARHGINRVKVIDHPVFESNFKLKSEEISKVLKLKNGDVILATVGFITPFKGVLAATKALSFLPANYKLAIIGGPHPSSDDDGTLDQVCDYIVQNNLLERAYITGYIEEDERLDALIRECDVCLYPYDKKYYSFVSSGALAHGLANYKPIVAYPTASFVEINRNNNDVLALTKSFNYYELARSIQNMNKAELAAGSKTYAEKHSFSNEAKKLIEIYKNLASS